MRKKIHTRIRIILPASPLFGHQKKSEEFKQSDNDDDEIKSKLPKKKPLKFSLMCMFTLLTAKKPNEA